MTPEHDSDTAGSAPQKRLRSKWELMFNASIVECDVCGEDAGDLDSGIGSYVLCDEHRNLRGWFLAWRLDRAETSASGS